LAHFSKWKALWKATTTTLSNTLFVDDDVILRFDTDLLMLEDVFHDTDLMNLFKEREDYTNQLRSGFDLKISAN